MTKPRIALPLLMLTISLGGLLSINCGILLAPVAIPAVLIDNQRQHFEIDILDPYGHPLTDVTVTLDKTYEYWNPIAIVSDNTKREILHPTAVNPLSIDRFAYRYIEATVEKPGYESKTFHFSQGTFSGQILTTTKNGTPRGTVTLHPKAPAANP